MCCLVFKFIEREPSTYLVMLRVKTSWYESSRTTLMVLEEDPNVGKKLPRIALNHDPQLTTTSVIDAP